MWTSPIFRFRPGSDSKYYEQVEPLHKLVSYMKKDVHYQNVFNRLRRASLEGNEKERSRIKSEEIPFYVLSAQLGKDKTRDYKNIIGFNPIAIIEFDNISKITAISLKNEIFFTMPSCALAWISPSGNGCKFIFRIPISKSIEEYKEYWNGLAYIFQDIEGFDRSNANCVLPLFLSYDPNLLFRKKPSVFNNRAFYEGEFKELSKEEIENILSNAEPISFETKKECALQVKRMICNIEGNGYPQLRSACLLAGGFFAGGMGEEDKWLSFLENLTRNNEYLSTSGGESKLETYLKLVRSAFYAGMKNPIFD